MTAKPEPTDRTAQEQKAYDAGWNLREMGHSDMLDTYKDNPKLRLAFEAGWGDAAVWREEKDSE
jgi:hypothetical protein